MAKPNRQPHCLLLVDDEPELLEILSLQVAPLGFRILTSQNGTEALEIIEKEGPNIVLVVSDYQMPKMNGFELRQAMLEKWKALPFVMVSAHISREEALKAVELKISAFLEKPTTADKLLQCIEAESKDRVAALLEEQELLTGFIDEARGNLELLEPLILELESRPQDLELVNRIFGLVHTLKGASGFFQPLTLHHFVHKFEDLLSQIKLGGLIATPSVISVILKAVTVLTNLVDELASGQHTLQLPDLLSLLDVKASAHPSAPSSPPASYDPPEPSKNLDLKKDLRISVELLDEFMQTSGELTVIRNMIDKVVRTIEKKNPGDRDIQLLSSLVSGTHKINTSIQTKILEIRKIPMKSITRSFPRVIREISQKLGKDVEFITLGDELRVDTAIADVLNTSLIHLLRNSLDHGLEDPAERTKAGKPSKGRITIETQIRGDDIIVLVSDDGKGIAVERIKAKLLQNGMPSTQLEKMTNQEILLQIFEPGFSTAAQVTEVSGRGIGMDMVKKSIQSLKGDISITTELGKGTTFTLKMPAPRSVLINNNLVVRCGDLRVCLPQDSISKVLEVPEERHDEFFLSLEGTRVLKLYDRLIPFLDLRAILKMPPEQPKGILNIIVLKCQDGFYVALRVDEILDIEDTVIKPLPSVIRNLTTYSGTTFLADGTVGLVLAPEGLAHMIENRQAQMDQPTASSLSGSQSSVDYILFEVEGSSAIYGLKQSDVQRLEQVPIDRIQVSGSQQVLPYRGQLLRLIDLARQLGTGSTHPENENFLSLILSHKSQLFGFMIKSILDIAQSESTVDDTIRDRKGIEGTVIIRQQVVTILNLGDLLAA